MTLLPWRRGSTLRTRSGAREGHTYSAILLCAAFFGCVWSSTPRIPPEFAQSRTGYRLTYVIDPNDPDPCVFGVDAGMHGAIPVFLSGEIPRRARGFLFVNFGMHRLVPATVRRADIVLTDSEGFRFRIGRGFKRTHPAGGYFLIFEVNQREALTQIRYNDSTYCLSLRLVLDISGEKRPVEIPKIRPTVERAPPRI